jgi:hypothetical protein
METGPGILWTAMPIELVVAGLEPALQTPMEMAVEGRLVQVLPSGDGTGTVQRLLSTNPADYLDPRWQPGRVVPLSPPL